MEKRVHIISDGPYEISGNIPLCQKATLAGENEVSEAWIPGKTFDNVGESYYLCRCGHSKTKPFCDGSHVHTQFKGTETANHNFDDDSITKYEGETLDLYDNESLCSLARFCDRGITAWDAVEASGNPENRALAIEEVHNCPSGRLILTEKDGTPVEEAYEQTIVVTQDTAYNCHGPLWVTGNIAVQSANFQEYTKRNRMTLCRCGESSNKPFCDSAHINCPHMHGLDE